MYTRYLHRGRASSQDELLQTATNFSANVEESPLPAEAAAGGETGQRPRGWGDRSMAPGSPASHPASPAHGTSVWGSNHPVMRQGLGCVCPVRCAVRWHGVEEMGLIPS